MDDDLVVRKKQDRQVQKPNAEDDETHVHKAGRLRPQRRGYTKKQETDCKDDP